MHHPASRPTLVHITTVPVSLSFLRGQAHYMQTRGFKVIAVSSPGSELDAFGIDEDIDVHAILLSRRITPVRDLKSLLEFIRLFRRLKPTIVHAHTPKAGLLGMMAATICRVPVRLYHLHGMRYSTSHGLQRSLLRGCEVISCRLAQQVIAVSRSLAQAATADKVCPPGKIKILVNGSINGVDAHRRFNPQIDPDRRVRIREAFGIPTDSLVLGFVGRISRDKGVEDLWEAWQRLRDERADLHLLLVGPFESRDPIREEIRHSLAEDPRVHLAGYLVDPSSAYTAMDVVALPSYREGFGLAAVEASAMSIPVVASRIPGCIDAVTDGVTGTLVSSGDAEALSRALRDYLDQPDLRIRHGVAGRERVLNDFQQEPMWHAIESEYRRLLLQSKVAEAPPIRQGADPQMVMKRALDLLTAGIGLVLSSPLQLGIAVAVRLGLGSPILFRQERPGLGARPFTIYKFRTMAEAHRSPSQPLPDQLRLGRLGRWLRQTSLDELPQLVNVLKGDMSLVGPRPLLPEYLDRYTATQARRHEVKPGITGWAQVNGRNAIDWEERLALDVWYVDHRSLSLDLKILWWTLLTVFSRAGISAAGHATMPRFTGSQEDA